MINFMYVLSLLKIPPRQTRLTEKYIYTQVHINNDQENRYFNYDINWRMM